MSTRHANDEQESYDENMQQAVFGVRDRDPRRSRGNDAQAATGCKRTRRSERHHQPALDVETPLAASAGLAREDTICLVRAHGHRAAGVVHCEVVDASEALAGPAAGAGRHSGLAHWRILSRWRDRDHWDDIVCHYSRLESG